MSFSNGNVISILKHVYLLVVEVDDNLRCSVWLCVGRDQSTWVIDSKTLDSDNNHLSSCPVRENSYCRGQSMPCYRMRRYAVHENRDCFVRDTIQLTVSRHRFVHCCHANSVVLMRRLPLAMDFVRVCLCHAMLTLTASHLTGFPYLPLAMYDYLICPIYAWPVRQSMTVVAFVAPMWDMDVSLSAYLPFAFHSTDYLIVPYYSPVTQTVYVTVPATANKLRHGDRKCSSVRNKRFVAVFICVLVKWTVKVPKIIREKRNSLSYTVNLQTMCFVNRIRHTLTHDKKKWHVQNGTKQSKTNVMLQHWN